MVDDDVFDLTGRVALVTGGGTGIGGATAMLLAKHGADVAIAARTVADLETTAAAIEDNAVNFAVFAGQCLSSGKGVAAVMFWMTHCGLIQRR